MIKRTSLVWKHPHLTDAEFRDLWLGEHVQHAMRLKGLREYVIDFVTDTAPEGPSGIATLRFDSKSALEAAFADEALKADLFRTRETFALKVQVMMVDELTIVPYVRTDER